MKHKNKISVIADKSSIIKLIEWLYDKANTGTHLIQSARELAFEFQQRYSTREQAIDQLIKSQVTKSAVTGFSTNIGGIATLPFSVPSNLIAIAFLQVRLIVAVAIICDYDPKSEEVKTLSLLALTGNASANILKEAGINMTCKLTTAAIEKISGQVLKKINKSIGCMLFTKFGKTGIINFVKFIPIAGGLFAAIFDLSATKIIGAAAKKIFYKPVEVFEPIPGSYPDFIWLRA